MAEVATAELLTEKQLRFVAEYLVDLNATQAAIRAGYSPDRARQSGYEALQNVTVQRLVEAAKKQRVQELEISGKSVLQAAARNLFANMMDYMRIGDDGVPRLDFSNLTRDQAFAIQELTVDEFTDGGGEDARPVRRVRFKLHGKNEALKLLSQYTGVGQPETVVITQGPNPAEDAANDARKRLYDKMEQILNAQLEETRANHAKLIDGSARAVGALSDRSNGKGNGHG